MLVCDALVLQGVAGGYAALATASAQDDPGQVVCSAHGPDAAEAAGAPLPDGSPDRAGAHSCCDLLCQIACASAVFVPANCLGPAFGSLAAAAPLEPTIELPPGIAVPERPGEARAPPTFSA